MMTHLKGHFVLGTLVLHQVFAVLEFWPSDDWLTCRDASFNRTSHNRNQGIYEIQQQYPEKLRKDKQFNKLDNNINLTITT